jgi:hypothetical protein
MGGHFDVFIVVFPLMTRRHDSIFVVVDVDYLGWLSLISTLEESTIENFGSTKVWVMEPSLFDI